MTNREQEFLKHGFQYCEGIEQCKRIIMTSGAIITKNLNGDWEAQSADCDAHRETFVDLLEAMKYSMKRRPKTENEKNQECLSEIIEFVNEFPEPTWDFKNEDDFIDVNMSKNDCFERGVLEGERLVADSIKNILSGWGRYKNSSKGVNNSVPNS